VKSGPKSSGATLLLPRPAGSQRRRTRRTGTRIAGLAVSDADTVYSQREVLDRLGMSGNEFAEGIFERCGVHQRHLDLSEDFLARTLQGRAAQIEQDLLAHSIRAVDALDVEPGELNTVISSSLYSLSTPTLAHQLLDHYDMAPTTDKYHVTGVGCASAVPLIRLASQTLGGEPDGRALVVAAESMSGILTQAVPDDTRAKMVGAAIFGDGCAAALLSNDPHADGPLILASQVHQIGDSLGAVNLKASAEDCYLHLARELPALAGAGLRPVVDRFLRHNNLHLSDIEHWVVHPGGKRIIENVQSALDLPDEEVATSWEALSSHGNIGTPSILYVLRDTIASRQPQSGEHGLMVTIGPGVTVGLMLLSW
jgi:alkylresorcinol/alkylpyrone synthase